MTILAALAASLVAAAADTLPPFHAYLDPPTAVVRPDSIVSISFRVDPTEGQFNGYTLSMTFDPSFVSLESIEEGSLMTDACPNRFEDIDEQAGEVEYTHVLLCQGVSLQGPGELSVFRFRALQVGQTFLEITSDPNCTFFDDGVCVGENHPEDPQSVTIDGGVIIVREEITAVGDPHGSPVGLHVVPNPAPPGGALEAVLPVGRGPIRVDTFDVTGRRVASFTRNLRGGRLRWETRDDLGRALPAGVYVVSISQGAARANGRIVLLD